MDSVFRFKQFSVENPDSVGLKVGTDGVLLGAAVSLNGNERNILDIGTGTGVIALILAQRLSCGGSGNSACDTVTHEGTGSSGTVSGETSAKQPNDLRIVGIDIDAAAAGAAERNFQSSPWSGKLTAVHCTLADFADNFRIQDNIPGEYDLVISNPPYYDNSLRASGESRNTARHTESLSYREVISFAAECSSAVAMILPKNEEKSVIRFAASFGFRPSRVLDIRTSARKMASRIIIELARCGCNNSFRREELTIHEEGGGYSPAYKSLTAEFYLDKA